MEMELTQNFLRGKNPCAMGYRWFVRNNLGGGDYQAAMDTQVAAGRVDDARWLLENFGSTNTVLELDHLEADNFVFAGTLIVHGDVRVPGQLLVGRSLQAGAGIRAGKLEVGEDIQSGGAIFWDELLKAGGQIIVVTHAEKIIPTFRRIYHIRDGRTYEEAGEGRAA
mgnify:CR=1 FL=1